MSTEIQEAADNMMKSIIPECEDWKTLIEWNSKQTVPLSDIKLEKLFEKNNNERKKKHKEKQKKEKQIEEDKRVETSLWIDEENQIMYEQVYDIKTNKSRFCKYDNKTKEVGYCDFIENGINKIYPILGGELEKEVIRLPNEVINYSSDEDLDESLKLHIRKWLDIPEDFMYFAIWSIKKSWVYQRFRTVSYLRTISDTGMGKSRFLDTLGKLHYKPIKYTGAASPAAVFRRIDKWRGTLILDEADFKLSDESQDMIKIINQGFEKGNWIPRCNKDKGQEVEDFDPFCPKVIGSRKPFTDKATESRCIEHHMVETSRKDIPSEINEDFDYEQKILRNMLLMWRFKNYWLIDTKKEFPFVDEMNLEPRMKQLVKGFVHLCTTQNQIDIFKKYIALKQTDVINDRVDSFAGQIIGAYWRLKQQGVVFITSSDIIIEGDLKGRDGKSDMKPQALNKYLKEIGMDKTKPIFVDNKTKRIISMEKEEEEKMFKRYGYFTKKEEKITTITTITTPQGYLTHNNNFKVLEGLNGDF